MQRDNQQQPPNNQSLGLSPRQKYQRILKTLTNQFRICKYHYIPPQCRYNKCVVQQTKSAHFAMRWESFTPTYQELRSSNFQSLCQASVTPDQISTFSSYKGIKAPYHQVPSRILTCILPYTVPVSPSTNQYRPILSQYHQIPTSTAPHCTTKYRDVLTQYRQLPTGTALH